MGKQIKQMQMESLRQTFRDVRDMVLLSATGVDCHTDNQVRLALCRDRTRTRPAYRRS